MKSIVFFLILFLNLQLNAQDVGATASPTKVHDRSDLDSATALHRLEQSETKKAVDTTVISPFNTYGISILKIDATYVVLDKTKGLQSQTYDSLFYINRYYTNKLDIIISVNKGKFGLLDKYGNQLLPTIYDAIEQSENSRYLLLKNNGLYGLSTFSGKICVPVEYRRIRFFWKLDNYIAVQKNDSKYGLLSTDNALLLPYEYDFIGYENEKRYFIVQKDKLFGVMDYYFNIIIPYQYEEMETYFYKPNLLIVKKDGKVGMITYQNEVYIPLEYDSLSNWVEYSPSEIIYTAKAGKKGIISSENIELIPAIYDKLYYYTDTIILVKKDDAYGIITLENKQRLPIEFREIIINWCEVTEFCGKNSSEKAIIAKKGNQTFEYSKSLSLKKSY